ncbi:MAG: metallopeptidase family protein [Rhodobacteraceae bacterium]|nr:metallopeptidase family protein [Paracoccaceae bacterium]
MKESEFEAIVAESLAALPAWVREALQNVSVLIEDEADEDLDPDGEGLLGLYTGIPLTERESGNAGELPDVIYLFRQPHLELELSADELREEIATTLIHEIAHYFGIDDDHLDDIGWG